MADQATKIAACPMPGCGSYCILCESGEGRHYSCHIICASPYCYESGLHNTADAAIAAHNALAKKDVGSYEDVAKEVADDLLEHGIISVDMPLPYQDVPTPVDIEDATQVAAYYITTKLSELMGPKDVAGLEEAVRECHRLMNENWHRNKFHDVWVTMATDAVVAAVRPFCDPETKRQRDAEVIADAVIKVIADHETIERHPAQGTSSGPVHLRPNIIMAISDCEATK